MTDDDEFEHIVKNSQRVLGLNNQYENRPYVEEFTKDCNFMFVYGLPNDASNFCRQMINCMKASTYLKKH